jgi:hypothetical protein
MKTNVKRLLASGRGRRVMTVLVALSLVLTVLTVYPLPAAAAQVFVGDELPAEGVSSGCDVKVVIVDKLSRYAVDLTYDTQALSVVSSGLCWDVNSLNYVLADLTVSDTAYAEHPITMQLRNYSDIAVTATGAAVQSMYGFGYTLDAPGTVTVAAAIPKTPTESGAPGEQTLTFMLRVPSLAAMTEAFLTYSGAQLGSYRLGTLTVRVGEEAATP